MPLSLDQYAAYLDGRHDLPWPAPPAVDAANARPHLKRLPGVRAILWNVYGTLLAIPFGELLFEHPTPMVMEVALDKAIDEFKMWGSMSRKPGAPSEYMRHLYAQELLLHKAAGGGERYPEVQSENLFRHAIAALAAQGIKPEEALHVGSKLARDLVPARKFGFRTALYAGDKSSLDASAEALKDPLQRPDVLLTELSQVTYLLG